MKLNDIKIPNYIKEPNPEKFQNKIKNYKKGIIKSIRVNRYNTLTDGYITYLIYKNEGVEDVDVVIDDSEKHLYVYGTHPNSPCEREYIWRVPDNFREKFLNKISIGSKIYCNTKFGIAPVIVTKIETSKENKNVLDVNKF